MCGKSGFFIVSDVEEVVRQSQMREEFEIVQNLKAVQEKSTSDGEKAGRW